jgi:hypothetical protein
VGWQLPVLKRAALSKVGDEQVGFPSVVGLGRSHDVGAMGKPQAHYPSVR